MHHACVIGILFRRIKSEQKLPKEITTNLAARTISFGGHGALGKVAQRMEPTRNGLDAITGNAAYILDALRREAEHAMALRKIDLGDER